MLSCLKRIIALITIIAVVAGMVYCINVSAASEVWEAVKGSPTITNEENGYTNIGVAVEKAVITKQKYNFEDNALFIENFEIPTDGGKWAAFTFTSEKKDTPDRHLSVKPVSSYNRLPSQGFLSLLVRVKDSTKLQFFVLNESGAEELSTTIEYRDDLYIRFVKTNSGYAMEANGKVLTHKNITDFCNGEFQKDAYVIIHSQNISSYMKGNVKIAAKEDPLWSALTGMPMIEDKEDGYTYTYVALGRSAVTNAKYNLEEKAVYIENFEIPEGKSGPWAAITFSSKNKSVRVQPKADGDYLASKGYLPILIRVNQSDSTKLQVFLINEKGEEQIKTAVDRSGNLFIRFVKTSTGYAMQVNEKMITHQYITDFCTAEFHKDSYVILHAESAYKNDAGNDVGTHMRGNVTISKPSWCVSDAHKTPVVYQSNNSTYTMVSTADDSFAYSTKSIDFDSQAMLFKKINIQDGKSIALNLSKTANDAVAATLNIEAAADKLKISLGSTSLGEIPKAYSLKIAVVNNGSKYAFVVNGKVLDCGNELNDIFGSSREVYPSLLTNGKFSTDIIFEELLWLALSGNPEISLSENKTSHIEAETDEVAIAPYRYDVFTTGVSVSNLQISDSDGALIYFGKTFDGITANASSDGITLLLEKTDEGVDISLNKNRYGKKGYIGTVAEADKYDISFYWNQRTRTLKVNNTEFKISKLTEKQSKTAAKDIEEFLGTEEENLVNIAFTAIGSAKTDLDLFYFSKPDQPFGVYIHTPRNVFVANGNDNTGYAAKTAEETYLVTTPAWDFRNYELQVDFNTVNGPVYLSVSKTGVSDENFWPTGEGDKINRTGFVITPLENNTKAQIAYYGANGVATETVITTIDFDWKLRHAYSVRKANDEKWYLYIDDVAMNQVVSPIFNTFMNSVSDDNDLYFILGSKTGFYVERFRFKKRVLPMVEPEEPSTPVQTTPGWQALYRLSGVFYRVDLEKAQDETYIFPSDKSYYAVRKGTEDITKTAFKIKFNSIAKIGTATPYVVFGLSNVGLDGDATENTAFNESNTARLLFRFSISTSSGSLTVKHKYGSTSEVTLQTISNFDFSATHTFDFRLDGGQWYLFVDGEKITNSNIQALQDYMEANESDALLYCLGTNGKLNADSIDIIQKEVDDEIEDNEENEDDEIVYEDTYIDPNVETWHYYSNSRGMLKGNDFDGYYIDNDKDTWAYTDYKYDHKKTSLSLKFTDTMVGEWGYFALCTSDYNDENKTPKGEGDKVNRVVLLMVPRGDSAEFQYWCINGSDAKATVIGTFKFDWFAEQHTFDVRKSEDDGNWYFCVDGKLLISRVSKTLNLFMETHKDEDLRYCYGATKCLGIENAKVVLKPALVNDKNTDHGYEDGDYIESEDFGFEFDFDNRDQEFELETDLDYSESEEEINPLDYLNKVKVKKRRLVSAAHGIIFTTLEIVGMIAGGVAVLAGATFLAIFLIKKRKKKAIK